MKSVAPDTVMSADVAGGKLYWSNTLARAKSAPFRIGLASTGPRPFEVVQRPQALAITRANIGTRRDQELDGGD